MALGYQNPFYLKQAQQKQQSLYNGKLLLEKHDPSVVYDSEETLQLAQESRLKMKQLNKEIILANYAKINQFSGEATKFVRYFKSLAKEADESLAKHKALEFEIERLLRAVLKAQLFDKVSEQKNTTKGTKVNTQFLKQSILGKPSSSYSQPKLYSVTPFPKSMVSLKGDETNALLKPFTSNSAHSTRESTIVKNDKVIAPGMFRIHPFKTSQEEKPIPNKHLRASVRTKPITISQPSVIHKKTVNSNSNGSSSTGVDNTAKTRRPQPRSDTKKDRLAIRNDKSEVVCGICKQCLITANHDVCVLTYLNDMNSRNTKQSANVSNIENQKKQKPNVKKPKKVGSKERLASPTPSEHRVDLLKGNRTKNLYIINLHDMASASPICLMARSTSTKSWLWHQRLSYLNFDTINDLAKNDLVTGLPKFKYHKEHFCPSCEQGKSKKASHPPKPVPNSKQRLHLLHMDLCGPMRVKSIDGKRYVLVIVDYYSHYTWVLFLRSKDEAP
ncbi:retrovirus-related pol polyprotein from transposon TNT 1-94 [Tanacetum coccineum]